MIKKIIEKIENQKIFSIFMSLYVFIDLCYFRGWKGVRLLLEPKKKFFFIIGLNPKKKNRIEIFFPIPSNLKFKLGNILNLFEWKIYQKKFFFKWINLAFIEQDGTLTYYRLTFNFNKTGGPIKN